VLHYTEKLIQFIARLHKEPQGCGESVASVAGPFTTKKTIILDNSSKESPCSSNVKGLMIAKEA
jgi:hypothetical protein